jgi:hypothetical protein
MPTILTRREPNKCERTRGIHAVLNCGEGQHFGFAPEREARGQKV